jgi:hypothetical protein
MFLLASKFSNIFFISLALDALTLSLLCITTLTAVGCSFVLIFWCERHDDGCKNNYLRSQYSERTMVHHTEWDRRYDKRTGSMQKDHDEMEDIIREMQPGGKHYHAPGTGVKSDKQILRKARKHMVHAGGKDYDHSLYSLHHGKWYKPGTGPDSGGRMWWIIVPIAVLVLLALVFGGGMAMKKKRRSSKPSSSKRSSRRAR